MPYQYVNPPVYKTILFAKTHKDLIEVLYFQIIEEQNFYEIQNFIHWIENTKKQKDEEERCKLYIAKYLSMLGSNRIRGDFLFFENILSPTSNFMLYYGNKTPKATILTAEQKERLKEYVFDDNYFGDIENTKLVYEFYPVETLAFYKSKLSEIRTYNDEFDRDPAQYNQYLEFILKKTNKWNREIELLLETIDDYYIDNTLLKKDIFERIVELIIN